MSTTAHSGDVTPILSEDDVKSPPSSSTKEVKVEKFQVITMKKDKNNNKENIPDDSMDRSLLEESAGDNDDELKAFAFPVKKNQAAPCK